MVIFLAWAIGADPATDGRPCSRLHSHGLAQPHLTLPDSDDRHVLAAAIRSSTNVIVTFNLDDFPLETLKKWGIEAQHPDDFINHLLNLAPHLVCAATKRQRESLKNPPVSVDDFLAALERQGLAQTVAELRRFADLI